MCCILLCTLKWLPIYFTICDLPKLQRNLEALDWEFFYRVQDSQTWRGLSTYLPHLCIYPENISYYPNMDTEYVLKNAWTKLTGYLCSKKYVFPRIVLLHSITIFYKILLNVALKQVWKLSFRSGILMINFE